MTIFETTRGDGLARVVTKPDPGYLGRYSYSVWFEVPPDIMAEISGDTFTHIWNYRSLDEVHEMHRRAVEELDRVLLRRLTGRADE